MPELWSRQRRGRKALRRVWCAPRQARVALRLRHPHNVQLRNFERHDDLHFLVLEFVEGRSLRDLLDEEPRVAAVVRVMGLAGSGGSMPVQISDWISENPGVARVDALGPDSARVTPVGEGATEIRAAAGDRTAPLIVPRA